MSNRATLNIQADIMAERWIRDFGTDEIRRFLESNKDYTEYQDDPVGFIETEMGISLTDDIKILAESVRDNQITVARSATGTGKSHGAAAIAIWFYKSFEDSRVYTVANPFENQKILWSEIGTMAAIEGLFVGDKMKTMEISRSDKDFITALTVPTTGTDEEKEGKFSGKHHRNMLFIVDEGDTVPDFAYRGIDGCMSGGHVRMLILFNPRFKSGAPYRLERDKAANIIHLSAFNHPNVISGEDLIPGAVDREKTVQRINEWCRPVAKGEKDSISQFELPGFLEGAVARKNGTNVQYLPLRPGKYHIEEPCFHYMVLGEYSPQSEKQLISEEWINNARSRWDLYVAQNGETPPAGVRPIQGGDVGEYGTDKSVSCLRYGGWVPKMTWWQGQDPDLSRIRFAEIHRDNKCLRSYIDATGVGAGVAEGMSRNGCVALPIKSRSKPTKKSELGEFEMLRDQLAWEVREWLRLDPGAMLPPDELLVEELLTLQYWYHTRSGKIVVTSSDMMREMLKRSMDRTFALMCTFSPSQGEYNFSDVVDG